MKKLISKIIISLALLIGVAFGGNHASAKTNEESLITSAPQISEKSIDEIKSKFQKSKAKSSNLSLKKISSNITKTSSDYPEVLFTNPGDYGVSVPTNIIPAITFTTPVQFDNDPNTGITMYTLVGDQVVSGSVLTKNNTLYIIPDRILDSNKIYMIDIDKGAIVNKHVGKGNSKYSLSFMTTSNQAPVVIGVSPFEAEMNVKIDTSIQVKFDRPIQFGRGDIALIDENNNMISVTGRINKDTLILTPKSPLRDNSVYVFGLERGAVEDSYRSKSYEYISGFITGDSSGGDDDDDQPVQNFPIVKGHTINLKVTGGKTPIKVTSSNSKIVSAKIKSTTLEIKGVSEGVATIEVEDKNGKSFKINFIVVPGTISF